MRDDPELTTPIGLARYAHDFFDSSRAVDYHYGKSDGFDLVSQMPALYLIGHSIELAFKSYLLHRDITLRELRSRKFGHDLHSCQRKAEELGLSGLVKFDSAEAAAVELLNSLYSKKQLNYIETGIKCIPEFGLLKSFAIKLIHAVSSEVGYEDFNR
ncbi:MAG: hypothetical protein V5B60_21140 [Accumulibacter sp.]|jgi:hypothetical protein|uniref:hypothetical protein n=1 Tax=Accumulibacter sp. TaxID=2053492 RepID=UPI002FC3C220